MSDLQNGIISAENAQQCDSCGKIRELRPYGPPGKTMICFDCATATPEMEAACMQNAFGDVSDAEAARMVSEVRGVRAERETHPDRNYSSPPGEL